jgi:putative hemolysin
MSQADSGRLHGVIAPKRLPWRAPAVAHGITAFIGQMQGRTHPARIYGSMGNLEVRLGVGRRDLHQAQRLRYKVFYEEMSASANAVTRFRRRDEDHYDPICDHLIVVDKARGPQDSWRTGRLPKVVGTYRLLRHDLATRHGFDLYTAGEYDIAPLLAAHGATKRFLEVGRSCVLERYRNGRTMEALWHGLWTYAREHRIDVMIGCASFPGTDADAHREALSFLHHHCLAPPEWRARARADRYVSMQRVAAANIDTRSCLKALPPLIKAYIRLGAYVGDGAVVDRQFGTTDVLVVLPVARIDPRYFERFGRPDERVARIAARNDA